ncbi:uncharacterized protein [Porites lutea]|uniref:uncharacterized protein n=1 Tax=Porites lutea TaxID=51062 RepID=UPI003CC567F4
MSEKSNKDFNNAVNCHICGGELGKDRVRDHCHFTEKQLPPKQGFYSKLNDEDISDEDYQHAIKVWNTFGCKTIRDYHDLYLKSDVLLLADVFENFRKTCLKHYKLDPAHYFTSPGLAWDACMKTTGQRLELLSDYDMLMMIERGIRGGITHISKRTEVYFNKPVYVGQSILDLSKTLMYDFHYEYIKSKYGKKAELLFTDTDSLMYHIKTKDFYEDICYDIKNKFDTSDYPSDHPSGILTGVNKKVIGMFKDEASGKQITHFVGLRPKLYSYKVEGEVELKKCKGIKKNVVKKTLSFDDYVRCLFSGEKEMRNMKIIRSEKHDLYSKEVNKVALSNQDDKRHVLNDQIHTLAIREKY